jgi:hypothetical protein
VVDEPFLDRFAPGRPSLVVRPSSLRQLAFRCLLGFASCDALAASMKNGQIVALRPAYEPAPLVPTPG